LWAYDFPIPKEESIMKKSNLKKLTLNRETVRQLAGEPLEKVQAGNNGGGKPTQPHDPGCNSQTLSCTL
jgi:hypothetical protein